MPGGKAARARKQAARKQARTEDRQAANQTTRESGTEERATKQEQKNTKNAAEHAVGSLHEQSNPQGGRSEVARATESCDKLSHLHEAAGTGGQSAYGGQEHSACIVCSAQEKAKCAAKGGCEIGWKDVCVRISNTDSSTAAVQLDLITQMGITQQLEDMIATFHVHVGWWARVKAHEEFKLMIGTNDLYEHAISISIAGRQLLSSEVRAKARRLQQYKVRQFNMKIKTVNKKAAAGSLVHK